MKIYLFKNHKRIVILFWVLITSLFWFQFLAVAPFVEATLLAFFVCGTSVLMNHYLSNHLLKKAMIEKRMSLFFVQFVGVSLLTTFVTAVFFAGFRYLEQVGFFATSHMFFEDDSLVSDFARLLPGTVVISLAFCGLRFYYEHARLEKVNRELQFKTLQEQITPHFMFNVLNHIHVLMEEDVVLASFLLEKYADILRYQLYQGQKEFIRLEQEVQFLKNYIEVEQIRWEDKLDVTCCWQTTDESIEIPPLLLITFIENAFKHVSRCSSAKGYVHLDLIQQGQRLSLIVENSTSPLELEKEASGLGLVNVRKRLDILYHKNYALTCSETDTTYCSQLTLNL